MSDSPVLFSVILPVFNTAALLGRCVDSVLECDSRVAMEVILVDDGSTDGSGALCDEYAAGDTRARVIHKPNGGPSSARNAGIMQARGEYLLFVDSDDSVVPGALAQLAQRVASDGRRDVILRSADRIDCKGNQKPFTYRYDRRSIASQSADEVLRYLNEVSHYPISPCVKLLSRSFVMEHELFFEEGMTCCEDVDHTYRVLLAARSFNYYDIPYYLARDREGSVMTSPESALNRFDTTFGILVKWADIARKSERGPVILAFLAAQYLHLCALYARLPRRLKKQSGHRVYEYAWLLAHGAHRLFPIMRLCKKVLGLSLFSRIMKRYFG